MEAVLGMNMAGSHSGALQMTGISWIQIIRFIARKK
jgi:hypothetical protein